MAIIVKKLGDTIEIRYHDVPIFVPDRALETIRRIAVDHLALALEDVKEHIADEVPVYMGALSQSFGTEITGTGLAELSGRVFSPLPYAIVVDQGRRPGARMPPIDAIRLWVKRKGLADGGDAANFGARSRLDQEQAIDSMAWAIAAKIAREGIEGRQFMQAGWAKASRRVEGVFAIMGRAIAVALVSEETGSGGSGEGGGRPSSSFSGSRYS